MHSNNYADALFNDKVTIKSQQKFRSDHHKVYTEEVNKIALSSNDDTRIQTFDKVITFPYGTNIFKVCENEMLLKNKLIEHDKDKDKDLPKDKDKDKTITEDKDITITEDKDKDKDMISTEDKDKDIDMTSTEDKDKDMTSTEDINNTTTKTKTSTEDNDKTTTK